MVMLNKIKLHLHKIGMAITILKYQQIWQHTHGYIKIYLQLSQNICYFL